MTFYHLFSKVKIEELTELEKLTIYASGNYSVAGFWVVLERKIVSHLLQIIMPSAMFVVVSWIRCGSSDTFTNLEFRIYNFFNEYLLWYLFQLANWEKTLVLNQWEVCFLFQLLKLRKIRWNKPKNRPWLRAYDFFYF